MDDYNTLRKPFFAVIDRVEKEKFAIKRKILKRKRVHFCNQHGWLYIRDIIVADKDLPNFTEETTLRCRQTLDYIFITYTPNPPTRFHTHVHIKRITRVPINWKQIQQK